MGYDAVEGGNKRKQPTTYIESEDRTLNVSRRRALVSTTRDIHRNFTVAAWAIRKHLDYVSTFNFQAKTGDKALDNTIEDLVRWWSRPENFDAAKRHGLKRSIRLAEERRTVDGDMFFMKLSDGHVQAIEGDRVKTAPQGQFPNGIDQSEFTHGVQLNADGSARAYCVCKRGKQGWELVFDRIISAEFILHHGFFDRFDQVRGISPLAGAVNAYRDLYESCDYALAKMKVSQLFALSIYRQASENLGTTTGTDSDGDGVADSDYKVDFGKGPALLDMDDGDRAEVLESKSPSTEFNAYGQTVTSMALKALDIPFSFYDESFTNYSGARQALLQYEQSAESKRDDVRAMLNNLTVWRLAVFMQDGVLRLPGSMQLRDIKFEWVAAGIPWIQPLQEVTADIAAVNAGFSSTVEVCKSAGKDAYEVADEEAALRAYRSGLGLVDSPSAPITVNIQPDGGQK